MRGANYDVLAVGELMQRSDDRELIEWAWRENRIFLTEDKDFGWLVFVSHAESAGVILIRYPGNKRSGLGQAALKLVQEQGDKLSGAFIVLQPGYVRFSQKPNAK